MKKFIFVSILMLFGFNCFCEIKWGNKEIIDFYNEQRTDAQISARATCSTLAEVLSIVHKPSLDPYFITYSTQEDKYIASNSFYVIKFYEDNSIMINYYEKDCPAYATFLIK